MSVANVGIKLTLDGAAQAEAGLRRVQDGMSAMGNTAESVRGALQQLAGAFAGVVSVRAFVQAADAVTQLQNQLKLATGSTQAAAAAYQQLFEIAQRSRVSFTELGGTFASIARASESLGLSQQQLLRLTETIGNAITVGGQSAAASQAALTQLSQGLASGVLRGEELNSILEQAPRLARALADGLGVSTGALRKMGEEGELTAERVIGALQSQASVLANEVTSSVVTVGQAFTQLQNSATALVGEIDRVSGSSATLAGALQAASESLDNIARAFRDTQSAGKQVNVFADAIAVVFETVAVLGVNVAYVIKQIRTEIGGLAAQAAAVARLDFSAAREIGRLMREDAAAARREVDALSDRILNQRRLAEQARQSLQGVDTRAEDARLARYAEQAEGVRKVGVAAADTKKKVKDLGDEFAAQRDAAKAWADAYQDFTRIAAQATAESLGLTKAQARLVEFLSSPAYANASEPMRQLALQQAYAAVTAEQNAAAQEQQAKAMEAAAKAEFERIEALERSATGAEEQLQRLLDEERALVIAAERNITLAQAIEEVAIARLRERQAAMMAEGDRDAEVLAIQREIDARKQLAQAIGRKEARDAATESAKEAAREWERTAENIERSLTDALLRGFESGKDFARNLRDTVVNMFNTMVLRPVIQAVVAPVAGGITGALGLPGTANAAQGGIGGASGVLSGLSGFGSALGLGLGAGFSSIGAAGIGGWLSAGTSLIGTGTLGGIGAGLGLLAGPVGGVLAIGGLLSSLFGDDDPRYKFLTNSSNTNPGKLFEDGVFVQSAYGNIGFDDYAKNIDANKFQETFQAIAQLDNAIAATLSPSENDRIRQALDGYVSGKDEATADYVANRLRIITDTVGGAIDQLADQFDGTSEEFVDYVSRLVQARSLIPALQDLGVALDGSSTAATQLALTLSDAFGGAQNAAQALAGYFQNYYTEAERVEVATRRLREAFAAIGVEMPSTREAFRALVEAQDLTTESGRKTYAALLQLSGAFAQVTDATQAMKQAAEQAAQAAAEAAREQAQRAVDAATDAAQSALSGLRDAVAAEQDRLRERFERESDILNDRIRAISDVIATLDNAIRSVRGSVETTSIASQTAARLTLQSVLTAVRGGADITGFESVIEQASATLTRNDPNLYQTREQFVRAQAQSVGLLEELNKAGGKQLTTAELQLKALEDGFAAEMARLDDLVAQAEKQINALLGIDKSVLSVEAAVKAVNTAIGQLAESVKGLASAAASQKAAPPVESLKTVADAAAAGYITSPVNSNGSRTGVGDSGYRLVATATGATLYFPGSGSHTVSGPNAAQLLAETYGLIAGGLNNTLIRTRAQGGYTPPGLTLVGEQGPELVNFRNPAMVYSNDKTSEILGNREVVAELKALRSEVVELRAQARRTADAVNGNPEAPMLVEAVA